MKAFAVLGILALWGWYAGSKDTKSVGKYTHAITHACYAALTVAVAVCVP